MHRQYISIPWLPRFHFEGHWQLENFLEEKPQIEHFLWPVNREEGLQDDKLVEKG
jgi:hypothetical protein